MYIANNMYIIHNEVNYVLQMLKKMAETCRTGHTTSTDLQCVCQ